MFYRYDAFPEEKTGEGLEFGFLTLTPSLFYVGVMTCIMTFPPTFLLMFLFRKARPMKLRENRINKALAVTKDAESNKSSSEPDEDDDSSGSESDGSQTSKMTSNSVKSSGSTKSKGSIKSKASIKSETSAKSAASSSSSSSVSSGSGSDSDSGSGSDSDSDSVSSGTMSSSSSSEDSSDDESSAKESADESSEEEILEEEATTAPRDTRKRRFSLPWFFQIIAWVLCIAITFSSLFFLWAYGISFGNDKTYQWLMSVLVSFWIDILVVEPLKVLVVAFCMSAYCKNVDLDSDDADEDEHPALLFSESKREMGTYVKPKESEVSLDEDYVNEVRSKRIKEVEMW